MTAPRRSRFQLIAYLGVVAALAIATFERPSRDADDGVDTEVASQSNDTERPRAHDRPAPHSSAYSSEAAGASLAARAFDGAQGPLDPDEHARRREERLAARAAERARWEEQKREARSSARARALEHAKDDAVQIEYLKTKFAARDERDRLLDERRRERRTKRELRAARPRDAVPPPSDAPLLGAPVIGEDGVAYDPHARTP